MKDFFTTAEAAEALEISQVAVSSLIRRGHLTGSEPLGKGRGYLIPAVEIKARQRRKKAGKLPKGGKPSHKSLYQ